MFVWKGNIDIKWSEILLRITSLVDCLTQLKYLITELAEYWFMERKGSIFLTFNNRLPFIGAIAFNAAKYNSLK